MPGVRPMAGNDSHEQAAPFPAVVFTVGLFVLGARLSGAEAGVEFTGFFRDDQGLTFALREKASGNTKLLSAGQEFAGYQVRSFDEKEGILTVSRDRVDYRLTLVLSKIKQVDSPPPEPPPEIKQKILNNLRQLSAAADQYFLENGVSKANYDALVGPTKYVKRIDPVAGEQYQGMQFEQGKELKVTTEQGHVVSYRP